MSDKRRIKCAKCGNDFSCQPNDNCWCTNYQISTKNLAVLKSKYKDCLCEPCIGKMNTDSK